MPEQPTASPSLAGQAGNWQSHRSVFTPTLLLAPGPAEAGNAEPFRGGAALEAKRVDKSEGHGGTLGKSLPI